MTASVAADGPRITNVGFDRFAGTVTITFDDPNGPGIRSGSLRDAANYTFNKRHSLLPGTFLVTVLTVTSNADNTLATVVIQIDDGRPLRGGFYQIIARRCQRFEPIRYPRRGRQCPSHGELYGPQSASGNGVPGGDFIANIAAFHDTTFSPGTIIGTPHPNDPRADFPIGKSKAVTKAKPVVRHPAATKLVRVRVATPAKLWKLCGRGSRARPKK